jgi:hypothetical protein
LKETDMASAALKMGLVPPIYPALFTRLPIASFTFHRSAEDCLICDPVSRGPPPPTAARTGSIPEGTGRPIQEGWQ